MISWFFPSDFRIFEILTKMLPLSYHASVPSVHNPNCVISSSIKGDISVLGRSYRQSWLLKFSDASNYRCMEKGFTRRRNQKKNCSPPWMSPNCRKMASMINIFWGPTPRPFLLCHRIRDNFQLFSCSATHMPGVCSFMETRYHLNVWWWIDIFSCIFYIDSVK